MEFVDTHCHIHFDDYALDAEEVLKSAHAAGVTRLLAVGCTLRDSEQGVAFAAKHEGVFATVGIHPHEAHHYVGDAATLARLAELCQDEATVAIGECGLDYYYNHSPRAAQIELLEAQLQLAQQTQLPVSFHVRDAFDDFLPILANFSGIEGVVHSFTAGKKVLFRVLDAGLYVGLNGILTFTKDQAQLAMAQAVPLEKMLLETDAPFLTPAPFRGKICEPRHVVETGKFLASIRDQALAEIAEATTQNVRQLFKLS